MSGVSKRILLRAAEIEENRVKPCTINHKSSKHCHKPSFNEQVSLKYKFF